MSFVVEGLVRFPIGSTEVVERFTTEFAAVELPVLESTGLGLAGAWTLPGMDGRELLHLYGPVDALADLSATARRMEQLPAEHPYFGLYSWIAGAGIRYSRTVRPLVDPVDRTWWERRVREPADAPYYVATCRYGLVAERFFRPVLSAALGAMDAGGEVRVAMAYDTLFGDFGSTRVIGTAPSRELFEAALNQHTAQTASERDPWVTVDAIAMHYSPLG